MRARRRRSPIGADIWPGFVDALASLLMVVIFLLMVFALAQHFLSDALSGRDEALAAATIRAAESEAEQAAAKARIAALDKDLATTTRGLDAAKAKAIEDKEQISSLEDALAAAVQKASETLAKLERTEARLATATDAGATALADAEAQAGRANAAEEQVSQLSADLAALRAQAASLSAALAEKSAESAERADALTASAASVASLEATLQALQASAASLEAALGAKTRESRARAQSLAEAADVSARQADKIATLESNIATLQAALADKSSESAERLVALEAAAQTQAQLDQTISNLEGALAALEARARQQQSDLTAAAQAADVQAGDLAEQRAALEAAEVTNEALGVELAALELRIQALSGELEQSVAAGETTAALADLRAQEIATLSAALRDADAARVALEGSLASAERDRDALSVEAARQAAALAVLKDRGAAAQASAESEAAALAKRVKALEQELAQSLRLIGAGEGRQAALREQVAALRQDLKDARRASAGADAAREALSARLAERGEAHAAAITEYRARIEALEAQISALNARARALQEAADAAETGLLEARRAASGLEADMTRAVDERKRIARLNDELQAKVDTLNTALDAALTDAKARGATILQLRGKLNAALAAKVSELKRYRSDFLARLSEVLGNRDDIRIVGDRFVLQSEVLFATAKAELGPQGQASIRAVARSLSEIVRTIPADVDWVLRVDGHTDQRPIANEQFPSNWELSVARAVAVVRALADAGIPADRLAAAGFGQHHPLDSAGTAEANRRNRRIEFKLTSR